MPRKRKTGAQQENYLARALDDLAEFDQFRAEVLPKIRKALARGAAAEDIAKMAASVAMAKIATAAITTEDPMQALSLAKEVLDRAMGKAAQRTELTQRFEKLPDEDLDQLLKSQLEDILPKEH